MGQPWEFGEFEDVTTAVVQTPTQTSDAGMGLVDTWAAKGTVGASGVVVGSLQAVNGGQQDAYARNNQVVDFEFYPAVATIGWSLVANGDRLLIGSTTYDVVWSGDQGGSGRSPYAALRRIN